MKLDLKKNHFSIFFTNLFQLLFVNNTEDSFKKYLKTFFLLEVFVQLFNPYIYFTCINFLFVKKYFLTLYRFVEH